MSGDKSKLFVGFTLLLVLFSLPIASAETNLLSEIHGMINHSITFETDDPDFALNIYGVDPERVTDYKIEEQKTKVINFTKYNPVEVVCKVQPLQDLNGDTPKCFEQQKEIIPNTIKYFEEITPRKRIQTTNYTEKKDRILKYYEEQKLKTILSTNALQITAGLKVIRISWKTPTTKYSWGSSGSWSMNPANWWDTDYEVRRPLNIGAVHTVIDGNYTHIILGIDSTAWNCADSNSIAIVYQAGAVQTEIDSVIQGVCGVSTDMNIFWRSQISIPANTALAATDTNGYYAYINDQTVAAPMRDCDEVYLICEDFEALNNGNLAGQNGWTGDITIDVVTDGACSSGGKCAKAEGDGSDDAVIKSLGTGAKIVKGYISVSMKQSAGGYITTKIEDGGVEKARVPFIRNTGPDDMGVFTGGLTTNFTEAAPDNSWRSFQTNFNTLDINSTILDGANAGEIINSTDGAWTEIDNVNLNMVDTTGAGEFDWWDDVILYQVLQSTPVYTVGAAESVGGPGFTIVGSDSLDPENGVNDVNRIFINTSDPIASDFNWFINSVQKSTDKNFSFLFTSVGDFNVSLIMNDSGVLSQLDQDVNITQLVQNVDLNFIDGNFTVNHADVNFGVTYDGNAEAFNWGFPQDDNRLGIFQDVNTVYTTNGQKTVCVTIATGDNNKTTCENFIVGRVIVKIPLDTTDLFELTPFNLTASNRPSQIRDELTTDVNMFFFNDANFSSLITVDVNSQYSTTSATFSFDPVDSFYIFQPYLLRSALASSIRFVVQNGVREGIEGIRIDIYKDIAGVSTLVQSGISDVTGSILFSLETEVIYTIEFYDEFNVLLFTTDNYIVTTAESFFYFNLDLTDVITPDADVINVSFSPATDNIFPMITTLSQGVNGVGVTHAVTEFYQWADGNVGGTRNVLSTVSQVCVESCSLVTTISTLGIDGNFNFYVDINVFSDNNTSITLFTKSYTTGAGSSINVNNLFINARKDFGCGTDIFAPCPLTTVLSIFLTVLFIVGIIFRFNLVSPIGLSVLALLFLGFFAYVGWFYWLIYAIMLIGILIGAVGRSMA